MCGHAGQALPRQLLSLHGKHTAPSSPKEDEGGFQPPDLAPLRCSTTAAPFPCPETSGREGDLESRKHYIHYSRFHCPNYIEHLGAGTTSDSLHCPPYPVEGLASGSL